MELSVVVNELKRWEEEKPRKARGYVLAYCPVCTRIDYTHSSATCEKCKVAMVKYDEEAFKERRRQLIVAKRTRIMSLANVLTRTPCARPPNLNIRDGYVEFESNCPTRLVYDLIRDTVHIYFFYFDTEQHRKALDYLVAELRRMNFDIMTIIYPPHTNPLLLPPDARFEGAAYVVRF